MDLAIVGAGPAGAAAAYALRDAPVAVTVFEASSQVGGRAATRERDDCRVDVGANYVKSGRGRVSELVTDALPSDGLVDVAEPVWTFDGTGAISTGDDRDDHKWTYESGIRELPYRLLAAADAEVAFGRRVGRLSHAGGTWEVLDDADEPLGTFDAVLLTPPAPRTADILAATEWDGPLLAELRAAADAVPYRSILSVALHYPFEVEYPWYALVNTDRDHAVGWLSREELKPGHVPDGEAVFVVQMATGWSAERVDVPAAEVTAAVPDLVAGLLDDGRFADPDWTALERWRDALPDDAVDPRPLRAAERAGLHVAGDWVVGDGRVHLAVENGLEVADRIADSGRT